MLRPAEVDDLDLLVSFTQREARESEAVELEPSRVRQGVGAALADPSLAQYFVILDDAATVGFLSIFREWSDWNGGFYCVVQGVFIDPEHRGRGLFGRAMDEVAVWANTQGFLEIRLQVHAENSRAVRAYEKAGFEGGRYKVMTRAL